MMTLTIAVIESNARRDNVAIINGVTVAIQDAPALTGSTKQIAWAEHIRMKLVEELALHGARRASGLPASVLYIHGDELDAKVAQINASLAKVAVLVAARTEASWWIDRRTVDVANFALELTA